MAVPSNSALNKTIRSDFKHSKCFLNKSVEWIIQWITYTFLLKIAVFSYIVCAWVCTSVFHFGRMQPKLQEQRSCCEHREEYFTALSLPALQCPTPARKNELWQCWVEIHYCNKALYHARSTLGTHLSHIEQERERDFCCWLVAKKQRGFDKMEQRQ